MDTIHSILNILCNFDVRLKDLPFSSTVFTCLHCGSDTIDLYQGYYCKSCFSELIRKVSSVQVSPSQKREVEYITGDYTEVYRFEPCHNWKNLSFFSSPGRIGHSDLNKSIRLLREFLFDFKFQDKNFSRRKRSIRHLINSNCLDVEKCSFLTLTYAENMKDCSLGKKDLRLFLKKLVYHFPAFSKYLWVMERQKRGAVHFHIVFFDVPFLHHSEFFRLWGKGFVDIHQIKDVRNLGSYVSSYMSKKEQKEDLSGCTWGHSENLKKPKIHISEYVDHRDRTSEDFIFNAFYQSPVGMVSFELFRKGGKVLFEGFPTIDDIKSLPF